MYAIKVYLQRPKENTLKNNYYLMRDLKDSIIHVYTRKEKAQGIVKHLQEQNPKMLIELTEDIPAVALARALKKKQEAEHGKDNKT